MNIIRLIIHHVTKCCFLLRREFISMNWHAILKPKPTELAYSNSWCNLRKMISADQISIGEITLLTIRHISWMNKNTYRWRCQNRCLQACNQGLFVVRSRCHLLLYTFVLVALCNMSSHLLTKPTTKRKSILSEPALLKNVITI